VLRNGRTADRQSVGQLADGPRGSCDELEDGPPGRIAERFELRIGYMVKFHLR
jgi:hypothetical protein